MVDPLATLNRAEQFVRGLNERFGGTVFISETVADIKPTIIDEQAAAAPPAAEPATEQKDGTTVARQADKTAANDTEQRSVDAAWPQSPDLATLDQRINTCLRCRLGETRNKFVFGVGNPDADLMVIGEAPGADEDAQGEPFVGRAGQLLNKILQAVEFEREDVYIANIIKCRPPGNRRPQSDEVDACEGYLFRQIELIKPAVILALGLTSVNTLLKANHKMGDVRGKQIPFRGVTLVATYHPAALLRNPQWKRNTWEDVKLVRRLIDEARGKQ